jgi:replication factor C small subunit
LPYVEKYRPTTFDKVVGQEHVIEVLKEIIQKWMLTHEKPPNMLFYGPAGVGKTTLARCFAKAIFGENWKLYFHEFNASDDRKIEVIRTKIKPLSQINVELQIIFFDEADGLATANNETQQALRTIIEKAPHTVFILSANVESKIIEPIRSRCVPFRFKPLPKESIAQMLEVILKGEDINKTTDGSMTLNDEERDGLLEIISQSHGDMRQALQLLEKIITAKKTLNVKSVLETKTVPLVGESLNIALEGKFAEAKNKIEDAYAMSGNNIDGIVDDLYFAVSEVKDNNIQARLYYELGQLEHHLRTTNRPLIQLTAFIAFVWVTSHVGR